MSIIIDAANDLDEWLPALADPTRRRIVEILGEGPRTAGQLHRAFPIAAPAVSRHLRVLRQAGLIGERTVATDRRVRLYALEPRPITELSQWCQQLSGMWQAQLHAFEDYVALRTQQPKDAA